MKLNPEFQRSNSTRHINRYYHPWGKDRV